MLTIGRRYNCAGRSGFHLFKVFKFFVNFLFRTTKPWKDKRQKSERKKKINVTGAIFGKLTIKQRWVTSGGAVIANFLYRIKLIFRAPKQYIFLNDISATTALKTTTKAIQLTVIATTRRIHFIYDSSWDKTTMERISSVRESFCSEDGEEVSTCFLSSHLL